MCDYSLCGIPNRLAVEGEELVVHRFPTGSIGLAPPEDLMPPAQLMEASKARGLWGFLKSFISAVSVPSRVVHAVCIPPGAHLKLKGIPLHLQREYGIGQEERVVFIQTSADAHTYRDALQFNNGRQLRLQLLREGLQVKVLSLASAPSDWRPPHLFEEDLSAITAVR